MPRCLLYCESVKWQCGDTASMLLSPYTATLCISPCNKLSQSSLPYFTFYSRDAVTQPGATPPRPVGAASIGFPTDSPHRCAPYPTTRLLPRATVPTAVMRSRKAPSAQGGTAGLDPIAPERCLSKQLERIAAQRASRAAQPTQEHLQHRRSAGWRGQWKAASARERCRRHHPQ